MMSGDVTSVNKTIKDAGKKSSSYCGISSHKSEMGMHR
jgi:hypothetical protein